MSHMGLGCVKTPTPAARVENLAAIAQHERHIILRTIDSMQRKRIIFSTFFRCMSFHTARVNRVDFAMSGLGPSRVLEGVPGMSADRSTATSFAPGRRRPSLRGLRPFQRPAHDRGRILIGQTDVRCWHLASLAACLRFGSYRMHSGHWPELAPNASVANDLTAT